MKKRFSEILFAVIIAACAVFGITSCSIVGNSDKNTNSTNNTNTSSTVTISGVATLPASSTGKNYSIDIKLDNVLVKNITGLTSGTTISASVSGMAKGNYTVTVWVDEDNSGTISANDYYNIISGYITADYTLSVKLLTLTGPSFNPTQFWAQNVVNNQWYTVYATNLASTAHSIVYVETANLDKCNAATAQNIANEFENHIYALDTATFGGEPDVDGNGKVIILVLDIEDGYSGGSYVAGYFDSTHEYSTSTYQHSNQKDMFFMDCNPATPGNTQFYTTLAHEFQHMINFNQKVFVQSRSQEDTWINEGLSAGAEFDYLGSYDNNRLTYYNSTSYNSEIAQGQNFVSWGRWGEIYGYYVTDYLFFQWLRLQSGDTNIYKDIINNSSSSYPAVVTSANSRITALSSDQWKDILRKWYVANISNDNSSIYGYKGAFTLSPFKLSGFGNYATAAQGQPYALLPGEGIYVAMSGSSLSPSGNIDYAGLTGTTPDTSSPFSGGILLAYNFNGSPSAAGENTGNLPSVALELQKSQANDLSIQNNSIQGKISGPLPVDVIFDHNGGNSFGKRRNNIVSSSFLIQGIGGNQINKPSLEELNQQ